MEFLRKLLPIYLTSVQRGFDSTLIDISLPSSAMLGSVALVNYLACAEPFPPKTLILCDTGVCKGFLSYLPRDLQEHERTLVVADSLGFIRFLSDTYLHEDSALAMIGEFAALGFSEGSGDFNESK